MNIRRRAAARRRQVRVVAMLVTGMLVAATCGGGGGRGDGADADADDDDAASPSEETTTTDVLDNPRWANVVSGPEPTDEEPVRGGSIVVALEGETNSYLPSASTAGQPGRNVVTAIFDPLVARDANGEIRPYLAESIEPDDDFTAWTLHLRPGVRFHDGTPLDAETLKRIWDDYLAEGPITGLTASQAVARMDVVDDLTVRYVMTEPNPTFPELLELQLGWPFSPDAADELGDEFGDRPVGTGPFKFVSWQRDGELVVERNEDYWREGQPYLDEIAFRVIPDVTTRRASLESGEIDALQDSRLSPLVTELADIDNVQVVLGFSNRSTVVQFNTTRPPTDDTRIRQALAYAVDQEAVTEAAIGQAAQLSEVRTQFFRQDSRFYSEAVAEAWPRHDPSRAQELYQSYVDDPDRSDAKDVGEPVSLTLDTLNTPNFVQLATAYEGFYEEIGFEVDVQPLETSQRTAAAVSGDFEAQIFTAGRDSSPLGEFLFQVGDPDEILTNFTRFHDETVADIIGRLRTTGDIEEQAAAAEEMGLHLAEELPWHWVATDLAMVSAKDSVRGLRSWTFPDGALGNAVTPSIGFWGQVWLAN